MDGEERGQGTGSEGREGKSGPQDHFRKLAPTLTDNFNLPDS